MGKKYLDLNGLNTLWTKIKAKITAAIQALDVSSVGGEGKYISAISETDGKISATATTMDTTPTTNSKKAVTSGGIKTALDKKVDVANVDLNGQSTTILAQVQSMASNQIHYKRFYTSSDGGSANISDNPSGTTSSGFMLEAYCNRYVSSSDWRYVVLCYVTTNRPKIAWIKNGDTSISWNDLSINTDTKVTQTADNSSTGTGFEVLFSATADNTTRTEASRKSNKLTFQPSTGTLTATKFSGPLTGNVTGNCSGSSGSCTGNAATATKATNANITRTADTTNGDKLQIGNGTAVNITNAKHAASADSATSATTATNYASGGGIATALSGKASTGHAHDDRYIRTGSGNKTLSFGGTTTLGTVQGNNVNLVMPEANADTYELYASSTSFEDALAAFNANKKLLLKVGKAGSGSYSTAYYLPLYRVQFNGQTITQFVWMLDSDAYGDASGSNTYGAISLYKLSESGWSISSDNVDYAKAAGTAYGGVVDYLKYNDDNEINFKNVPTSGGKGNHWFNYRNGDTHGPDASNPLTDYFFGDRNKGTNTTLHAKRLAGSADKWNGWNIVVGSTGTDPNTLYFV